MGTAFLAIALLMSQAAPTASGSLSGRVLAMNGEPAIDARIQVIQSSEASDPRANLIMGLANTDADGRFRVDKLPAGRYILAVGSIDTPTYFPGVRAMKDATVISILAGAQGTGFDFKMVVPPPLKLSGRVNFPDGDLRILVRLAGASSAFAQVGADGAFQFSNLRPGEYELFILRLPAAGTPGSLLMPVRVTLIDCDITGLELGIPPASVRVNTDVEHGGPLPRFQLKFNASGSGVTTSEAFRPGLSVNLQPGTYRVTITGLPEGFSVSSIRAGVTELGSTGLLIVASKDSVQLSISLAVGTPSPWVKVRGKVTGGESRNVRAVEFYSPVLAEPASVPVASDGSFEVPMLLPGTYTVRPSPSRGYFPRTLTVRSADIDNVEVSPPTKADLVGDFVQIMPGEFMMGCSPADAECLPEERPSHKVRITKGFEIGRFEVMQMQWESLMGSNPSQYQGETLPVENLNTWDMVVAFLEKLNALNDGYRYRIPTEAEWEYAARAGSEAAYFAPIDSIAWHGGNSMNQNLSLATLPQSGSRQIGPTHPVGMLQPNAWGLHDTQGNVWEWTSDWYDANYFAGSPAADPNGPASGPMRVMKGGSAAVPPPVTRVSIRGNQPPVDRSFIFGLRLIREQIR